jgi:predicted nuclease with TOPRIM domain
MVGMSAQVQEGVWLPLLEYAHRKGLSLSTLRRYIKSNKHIRSRPLGSFGGQSVENLKLIQRISELESELNQARMELKKLKEEAVELKMLIAFYEESGLKAPTPTRNL